MEDVGDFVQEAINLMNSGSFEMAVIPTARSIEETIRKSAEMGSVTESDHLRFIKENFDLISFMGMPRALPLPMNIPFGLNRIFPRFNVHHGAVEIVAMLVSDTIRFNRLTEGYGFSSSGKFEVEKSTLLLPSGLVCGLLGSVIFHPVNTGQEIGDEYWISISDFKMFVSELFGRKDLADRIMHFYQS